jgi:Spy/CpxP family protein refolding chaperone
MLGISNSGRGRVGGLSPRIAIIAVVMLLVAAGVVMTATAAPGPSGSVKAAGYGATGPCANVKGEAGQGQCAQLQDAYDKAKAKCKKKHGAKRKKCLKKAKNKEGKALDKFVHDNS